MKGRPVPDRPATAVARFPTGDVTLSDGTRLRYRGRVPGADFRSSGAWESVDGLVVTAGVVELAAGRGCWWAARAMMGCQRRRR